MINGTDRWWVIICFPLLFIFFLFYFLQNTSDAIFEFCNLLKSGQEGPFKFKKAWGGVCVGEWTDEIIEIKWRKHVNSEDLLQDRSQQFEKLEEQLFAEGWGACSGIRLNANSGIICSRFQRRRLCNSWQPVWVNSICDFQHWRGKDQSCTPCLTPTTLPPDAPELCIWLIDQRCLSNRTRGGSPVPRLRLHRQWPDLNLEKLEERFAWKRRDSDAQPPWRVAHGVEKKT